MNRVHYVRLGLVVLVWTMAATAVKGQSAPPAGVPDVAAMPANDGTTAGGTTVGAINSFSGQKVQSAQRRAASRGVPFAAEGSKSHAGREGARRHPYRNGPGSNRPMPVPNGSRVTGNGMPAAATSSGSPAHGGSRLRGDSGSTGTGNGMTRGGIAFPVSGASARRIGSIIARTARLTITPTTSRASPPIPTASTSPASIIPTVMAWSGRKATGPRCSPAGRGFPPSGFASRTAGSFRRATGIEPSRIVGFCSHRPKSTRTRTGADDLTYQPYSKVSPEMYGQLNGAFGRPNANYDGYPGRLLRRLRPLLRLWLLRLSQRLLRLSRLPLLRRLWLPV